MTIQQNPFRIILLLFVLIGVASCDSEEELKRQQYVAEGFEVYKTYCSNCHQPKGEGLAALYPPLANSDFLTPANKALVICGIRNGFQHPLQVNGKVYRQPMPAHPQLQPLDLAVLTTFLYNEWGSEKKITEVKEVEKSLAACPKP